MKTVITHITICFLFTLFFISEFVKYSWTPLFSWWRHGHMLINEQNGSVWPVQTGSRKSKGMFFPNALRIYTGFNCCCCLCVPGAVKMLAVRMAGIVWTPLLQDTGSHVRAIRWLLTAPKKLAMPSKASQTPAPTTRHIPQLDSFLLFICRTGRGEVDRVGDGGKCFQLKTLIAW